MHIAVRSISVSQRVTVVALQNGSMQRGQIEKAERGKEALRPGLLGASFGEWERNTIHGCIDEKGVVKSVFT